MTESQRLTIKASEQRSRLAELATIEELNDEQRAELDTLTPAHQDTERQLRAAIAAEGDPNEVRGDDIPPEVRERIELRGRSRLTAFLTAQMQGRQLDGAEAEYAAAFDCPTGHVPMDLWEGDRPAAEARQREGRAATPAPAAGTGVTVAPIQPFVFAPSIAPRLGIDMPSVGSGSYSEMTITTKLPAAPKVKAGDADDTAGALTALTANPRRIASRMTVTLEDVARIGQDNFEAALRANVSMALSDAYDNQVINGDGSSPNVEGLIDQLTDPTNPTTVADFAAFLKAAADQVDGLWAGSLSDVGIVVNPDAYRLSARVFRAASADLSFSDYARQALGAWWTNTRMPASASTIARGVVYRMGRMGLRTACHPTWGTVSIDDIFTSSRSGQRHFTVATLVGDKVLIVQPGAYNLVEYKVA